MICFLIDAIYDNIVAPMQGRSLHRGYPHTIHFQTGVLDYSTFDKSIPKAFATPFP